MNPAAPVNPAAPKVFISYRREDTSGHAGRLYDAMAARFGESHVFVDIELAPGIDFVQRIREAVGACHVLLVMIGPRWAVIVDDDGQIRITDPEDFVRLEVETALRRPDVTVIPALVAGAEMPDPDDLPESLRPLTHRNALELSDMRWRYDVGRLNGTLDVLLADTLPSPAGPAPGAPEHAPDAPESTSQPDTRSPSAPRMLPSTARLFIDGMLVAGAAGLVATWLGDPIDPADQPTEAAQIATSIISRTLTWAAVGVALASWLTIVRGEGRLLAGRAVLGLALGALAGALGGVLIALPQYLQDLDATAETVRAISVGAFAVSGAFIGALLGSLWTPRSAAVGFIAGLVGGALVRLLWNAVDWSGDSAFEESLGIGVQCLLIIGLVLATLHTLSTHPRFAVSDGSVGAH